MTGLAREFLCFKFHNVARNEPYSSVGGLFWWEEDPSKSYRPPEGVTGYFFQIFRSPSFVNVQEISSSANATNTI